MKCSDVSVKHKRECGSPANAALEALGLHYCTTHGKRRGLLSADGKPSHAALSGVTTWGSGKGAEAAGHPDPARALPAGKVSDVGHSDPLDLPPAPALEDEPSTAAPDVPAPAPTPEGSNPAEDTAEVDRLSKLEAGIFGKTFGKEQTPESVDATVPEIDKKTGAELRAAGVDVGQPPAALSREDSEEVIKFFCNPLFRRTGKDLLDEDEVSMGGKAMQPVFNAILANPGFPPYMMAGLWGVSVFGSRYGGDIKNKISGKAKPKAERATREIPDPTGTGAPAETPTQGEQATTETGKPLAGGW